MSWIVLSKDYFLGISIIRKIIRIPSFFIESLKFYLNLINFTFINFKGSLRYSRSIGTSRSSNYNLIITSVILHSLLSYWYTATIGIRNSIKEVFLTLISGIIQVIVLASDLVQLKSNSFLTIKFYINFLIYNGKLTKII